MATTFNWIHLGTGPLIDPTEGNTVAASASALVGTTYGTGGSPLSGRIVTATVQDTGGTAGVLDQNNSVANDTFTTNIGAGSTTYTFDATAIYTATITYADGTTATVSAVIVQDTNGNLFLAPEQTTNADTAAYEAKPIQSLTLNSLDSNDFAGLQADRFVTGFDDGYVDGTAGNDLIDKEYIETGMTGSDRIDNNDAGLAGSSGNDDYIRGGGGNDTVYANLGNDRVFGGDGADSLFGGTGNDSLVGGTGVDTLFGGDGNDSLEGGTGYDIMHGDAGNDLLLGDDTSYDDLYGGDGNDTIFGGNSAGDYAWGGAGDDLIQLGAGNGELAFGGAGADTIFGGDGTDTLKGDAGNDSLAGDAGVDWLNGGAANDTLDGGNDNDSLYGGAGADLQYGGAGNDSLAGDADVFSIAGNASTGPIDTTLTLTNAAAFAVDVYWINSSGTQVYYTTVAAGGSYSTATGAGHNWYITETGQSTPLQLITGAVNQTVTFGPAFNDTQYGGAGTDTIQGGYGADLIYGGTENDSVAGGADADVIYGDAGDDSLTGDAGNDTLSGGIGSDTVSGGAGSDTFWVTDDHQFDTIFGGESGGDDDLIGFGNVLGTVGVTVTYTGHEAGVYDYNAVGDASGTFSEIESISGTGYADTLNAAAATAGVRLVGNGGADAITGGAGADSLFGGDGLDSIAAGAGDDSVDGGDGTDTLEGRAGNDTIYGGAGNDVIDDELGGSNGSGTDLSFGGTGNDTVYSGDDNDTAYGGADNDLLVGENGNDLLFGDTGNDSLYGGTGNDSLSGGDGTDSLQGDAGDDSLSGDAGNDALYGGDGNDILLTGSGDNEAYGGANEDYIADMEGNSYLSGGMGHDTIYAGAGDDTVFAGTGNNLSDLGSGNDSFGDWATNSGNDTIYGAQGNDTVIAGSGDDVVYGGEDDDQLSGALGSDTLYGGSGSDAFHITDDHQWDSIVGGEDGSDYDGVWFSNWISTEGVVITFTGDGSGTYDFAGTDGAGQFTEIEVVGGTVYGDTIYGGASANGITLHGGEGDDVVYGGSGADIIEGGDGSDVLYGGANWDYLGAQGGNDTLYGGADGDTISVTETSGTTEIYGGEGGVDQDTLFLQDNRGDQGGVTVTFTGSETGTYAFTGTTATGMFSEIETVGLGDGADSVDASGSTGGVTVSSGAGDDTMAGSAFADTLHGGAGNDSTDGGDGNDLLCGQDGDDTLTGGAGNDTLDGGADADVLSGGAGDDTLGGADGDDLITGGQGNDRVSGGAGSDTAAFSGPVNEYSFGYGPNGALVVTDSVAGRDGSDTLDGIDYVTFNGTTYHLVTGDDGANTMLQAPDDGTPSIIVAHEGNDWGGGHATSDAVFGGAGDDTLDGGDGNDTLVGEGDNDLLRGDAGDDALFGGDGRDTLQGGTGNDMLQGGAGDDVLGGGAGHDTLSGDAGRDTLSGGAGDDGLTGGTGDDLFVFVKSGGIDRVTDFDTTLVDGRTLDQLDVSALRNASEQPVTWRDVTVGVDQDGNAVLMFPGGEQIVLEGVTPQEAEGKQSMSRMGIPCFVTGTRILTPHGTVAIENLRPGMILRTRDHGDQPILWAGSRHIGRTELRRNPALLPVRIAHGALGNAGDLWLSPQHAVVVGHNLVRAKHLAEADLPGITRGMVAQVTYHHLLLPQHAILHTMGIGTESLYPGVMAAAALGPQAWLQLCQIIPGFARIFDDPDSVAALYGVRALPLLGRGQAFRLVGRADRIGPKGNRPEKRALIAIN